MAGHQRRRDEQRFDFDQRDELAEQHQHEGDGPEASDARILHDLQRPFARPAAAETVDHVGPAVLVEGVGGIDRRRHRGEDGEGLRQNEGDDGKGERTDQPDDQPDGREIACRMVKRLRRMTDPARHREAREEAHGAEEIFQLADKEVFNHGAHAPKEIPLWDGGHGDKKPGEKRPERMLLRHARCVRRGSFSCLP